MCLVFTQRYARQSCFLLLELFNLLINPIHTDYEISWHRDAIISQTPEEEEKEKLSIPPFGIQWNTALYGTSILNFKIFKLTYTFR